MSALLDAVSISNSKIRTSLQLSQSEKWIGAIFVLSNLKVTRRPAVGVMVLQYFSAFLILQYICTHVWHRYRFFFLGPGGKWYFNVFLQAGIFFPWAQQKSDTSIFWQGLEIAWKPIFFCCWASRDTLFLPRNTVKHRENMLLALLFQQSLFTQFAPW